MKNEDNSQQDKLVTLFVADWPETGNYQVLVDKYAPILYFDNGQGIQNNPLGAERYNIPYDVERTTWLNKPKDYRLGDSTTVIDLSSYAINPRNNTSGKVYAAVVKHPNNGEIAINYYFHYPRSNWKEHGGRNTHEGDWEGATVFLDKNLTPQRISFSQHVEIASSIPNVTGLLNGGQTVMWSLLEKKKMLVNGRPKIYVGLGGHASYYNSGQTNWAGKLEFHRGNLTPAFDSQGKIQYLPRIHTQTASEWLRFPGYWGNEKNLRGPVFLDVNIGNLYKGTGRGQRWLDPWEWSKSFDVVRE